MVFNPFGERSNAAHDTPPHKCVSCGAEVGEAKFCPECATPVIENCPDCASCGHRIEGSPKFCPECGAELASGS